MSRRIASHGLWLAALGCVLFAGGGSVTSRVAGQDKTAELKLKLRKSVKIDGQPGEFRQETQEISWKPAQTAIIVVDMWDDHHCLSAAKRVVEMAPHVNRTLKAARNKGVLIIHAPSDCMDFYDGTPQRRRAQEAPLVKTDTKFQWNYFNPACEGPLEDKLEKAGCSCDTPEPCSPSRRVWKQEIDLIEIAEADAISADGQEVYNLLQSRGIENVVLLGVHINRCVLGRPFGIRQMVSLKKNVVLCRDLTDSYHRDPGRHFEGLEHILTHVERWWCPTITSDSLTGEPAFRFRQPGK